MKRILLIAAMAAVMAGCTGRVEQYHKGWPEKNPVNLRESFVNPPAGYGNVPFYWWSADTLKLERLEQQLDLMADASTDGFCVSYNHMHWQVDTLDWQKKHGMFGALCWGTPKLMSEEWFDIWNKFSAKCADKGIGLGMDDYVIQYTNNGTYKDSVVKAPDIASYLGRLKRVFVPKDSVMPDNVISVTEADKGNWVIYAVPSFELHPEFGKRIVDKYFNAFDSHMDKAGKRGANYFFQDELELAFGLDSWCEGMDSIFKARKGYDIVPYLDRMFIKSNDEIDSVAAKVRMDYADVVVQLGEERYLKPVFDWSNDRGLIYGCDNVGRGLAPLEYLDYFRVTSWFTAPGNDAPARGSSFRQTKVSSSIAHMYGRPRTWLEGFHSMGWNANGGVLTRQLDHHIIAGGNLLCIHGLYYSTHGGWWEWAPPCFHFRMPYWPHMKRWLKYSERMCYLLSQGSHVCDIAILYPTETMQAYPQSSAENALNTGMALSERGLDYDYIDFRSLWNADAKDGKIAVKDESYRILLVVDMKAMHRKTLDKIREFAQNGGIVLTAGETMAETACYKNYGIGDNDILASDIRTVLGTPDFVTESGMGKVLHRRAGENDIYMIMDVKKGEKMTFRATGKPELWDAFHGTSEEMPVTAEGDGTRTVRCTAENGNSMVIVFTPGECLVADDAAAETAPSSVSEIGGEWDIEIIPTMDNSWGDFRLPATKELIGVEAREMTCQGQTYLWGNAPYMRTATVPSSSDIDKVLPTAGRNLDWQPYVFSWQYGVPGNPGGQGYHGLKAKIDDRFLILDKGAHQIFEADALVEKDGDYDVISKGVEPYRILIDDKPAGAKAHLEKGWHKLTVAYANTKNTPLDFSTMTWNCVDERERGMVMLYPEGAEFGKLHDIDDAIVASGWYGTDFVKFGDPSLKQCTYSFKTAPGTRTMEFDVKGRILSVKADGEELKSEDGRTYAIEKFNPGISDVEVTAEPETGYHGGAFFLQPVKIKCSGGKLAAGNWSDAGALMHFSGGIRYSRHIEFPKAGRIVLDLGKVDATAEVFLNGKSVDVLLCAPYRLDITDAVKEGDNLLEVLVYSSLSNHYQTIPTGYKGEPSAGLFGPVTVSAFE